jgi:hypothetical protein
MDSQGFPNVLFPRIDSDYSHLYNRHFYHLLLPLHSTTTIANIITYFSESTKTIANSILPTITPTQFPTSIQSLATLQLGQTIAPHPFPDSSIRSLTTLSSNQTDRPSQIWRSDKIVTSTSRPSSLRATSAMMSRLFTKLESLRGLRSDLWV